MPKAKCVSVDGQVYASMADAELALDLSRGMIGHWLTTKPERVRKISKEEYFDTLIRQSKEGNNEPK